MLDVERTFLSQYATAPVVTGLILRMNAALDPTLLIQQWFDQVWNVNTAVGYGLDVWGHIVGVPNGRLLNVADASVLGFDEATTASASPWNQGIWYNGGPLTGNFLMSDDSYRQVILAKAAANISDGSIPSINQILLMLFPGRGNCYVTDGLDMTMTYTFKFLLSAVELAIVSQTGVLPKPCGVSATVVVSP